MKEGMTQFKVIMTTDMRDRLAECADEDFRSMHSMVLKIVSEYLDDWKTTKEEAPKGLKK